MLASLSLPAASSFMGFMAGSARSWPKPVFMNDSRSSATFLTLAKNRVESGCTFSGSAAWPTVARADTATSPRQPVNARRKAARNGIRIK